MVLAVQRVLRFEAAFAGNLVGVQVDRSPVGAEDLFDTAVVVGLPRRVEDLEYSQNKKPGHELHEFNELSRTLIQTR